MASGQRLKCRQIAGGEEIGRDEDHRLSAQNGFSEPKPCREIGGSALRLDREEIVDDAEDVAATATGRYEVLYSVADPDGTDPVVVPGGRQRQHRRDLD